MLTPPIAPMLARLARELPTGPQWRYEPKWDGFRALLFRSGDGVALQSRNGRPLARYFPEVVDAAAALPAGVVLDGEIVLDDPALGFSALLERIHPAASRVVRLAAERPASFVAFDLLAVDGDSWLDRPFADRRGCLEATTGGPPSRLRPGDLTTDVAVAGRWLEAPAPAWDGVVAKDATAPYRPGRRDMVKVKQERTADCVVAGARFASTGVASSLLLGLWGDDGTLHHPGAVTSLSRAVKATVAEDFPQLAVPLADHPWRHGFGLEGGATGRLRGAGGRWLPGMTQDWLPLAPTVVVEVAYDRVDGIRFRHPARFRRWRPDRDPGSCRLDQLPP